MPRKMKFGRYDFAAFGIFAAYAAGTSVLPVALVRVADELGFPLGRGGTSLGGWLHMIRTLAICSTLATGGLISGRWGNRRPLGAAMALIGAGLAVCAGAPSYVFLLAALVVVGLGEGVVEGLATPFVQGMHTEEPARYMNFSHGFWSLGMLSATLLFGLMLRLGASWRALFAAAALFTVPVLLLLMLPRRRAPYPERPVRLGFAHVASQALAIFRAPRFWLFFAAMLLAGGGELCLTFWVASFVQNPDYFAGDAMSGGIATAVFAFGMFAGRTGFGFLMRQRHLRGLIMGAGVFGVCVCLLIPWLACGALAWKLQIFYVVLLFAGIATAPFWPSLQTHCVELLPQCDATMLYVLLSCAGIPGCGLFTLIMGFLAKEEYLGMARSFYIVPACFAGIVALMFFDRKKNGRPLSRGSSNAVAG